MWTSLLLRWWLPIEKTVEKKTPIGDEDVFPIVTIHFQQEGRNENTKKFQKEEDEKNIWGAGLPIITIFSWEIHKLDCVTLAKREPVTTNVVRSFFFFLRCYAFLFKRLFLTCRKYYPPPNQERKKKRKKINSYFEINFGWEMLWRYLVFFTFMRNFFFTAKNTLKKSRISGPVVHFQMIPLYL